MTEQGTQTANTEHARTGEQSMTHRREFAASAELVQRAHCEPDLFVQWMGPRGTTVRLDRFAVETGGAFAYAVVAPNGDNWTFHGSYHEVTPGRIIHTWQYDAEPHVTLETLDFSDLGDGRSTLTITSTYPSKQACDDMVDSGMDAGMDGLPAARRRPRPTERPVVAAALCSIRAMPRPLVLTSSARVDHESRGPRNDVDAVAGLLGADVLAPLDGAGLPGLVRRTARLDLPQALAARRTDASAFLCMSERVGIPLRAVQARRPQATVVHSLTDRVKVLLARAARFDRPPSRVGVFSRAQVPVLRDALGIDATFVPHAVDERFWAPQPDDAPGDYLLSVGREQRDWDTLAAAVAEAGVRCIVVGGSPWSTSAAPAPGASGLEHRSGLSVEELRGLYAGARAVVVPLLPGLQYAAGLTTLCEAQAVGRPVIVTDTPGLRGEVRDGETGRLVPAADPAALAAALRTLLDDESAAAAMGVAARAHAESDRSFDGYIKALAALVPAA